MCERCLEPSFVKSEPLDRSAGAKRTWPLDDEGERMCDAAADVVVFERTVDEHLCEACMSAAAGTLDDGLGDLLRWTGLASTNDFLPVTASEPCDRCGEPARFAWAAISPTPMCRAHAEENGCPQAAS